MISKMFEKLKDPEYRKAFVASQINIGIPFQIRGLLKSRPEWTQTTLAEKAGMLQPRISGLMTPGKVRPNIETLRRIAEAFDCALVVRFAQFSELAKWSDKFNPESFNVPSFADDNGLSETAEAETSNSQKAAAASYGTSLIAPLAASISGSARLRGTLQQLANANVDELLNVPAGYLSGIYPAHAASLKQMATAASRTPLSAEDPYRGLRLIRKPEETKLKAVNPPAEAA